MRRILQQFHLHILQKFSDAGVKETSDYLLEIKKGEDQRELPQGACPASPLQTFSALRPAGPADSQAGPLPSHRRRPVPGFLPTRPLPLTCVLHPPGSDHTGLLSGPEIRCSFCPSRSMLVPLSSLLYKALLYTVPLHSLPLVALFTCVTGHLCDLDCISHQMKAP